MELTINQMHEGVRLELDKTDALALPSFLVEEVDYWLNTAYDSFIKSALGIGPGKTPFDNNSKRLDEIRPLIEKATPIPVYNATADTYTADLPSDYMYIHDIDFRGTRLVDPYQGKEVRLDGEMIPYGDHQKTHEYVVNRPYTATVPFSLIGDKIIMWTAQDVALSSSAMYYIRKPLWIDKAEVAGGLTGSQTIELEGHTHLDIVKQCASLMLENVEQPRYQTHNQISKDRD